MWYICNIIIRCKFRSHSQRLFFSITQIGRSLLACCNNAPICDSVLCHNSGKQRSATVASRRSRKSTLEIQVAPTSGLGATVSPIPRMSLLNQLAECYSVYDLPNNYKIELQKLLLASVSHYNLFCNYLYDLLIYK